MEVLLFYVTDLTDSYISIVQTEVEIGLQIAAIHPYFPHAAVCAPWSEHSDLCSMSLGRLSSNRWAFCAAVVAGDLHPGNL